MNQSVEFLKVIDEVQKREIPEYVLRRAKQSLLDYLAVSSAGAVFQKEARRRWHFRSSPINRTHFVLHL